MKSLNLKVVLWTLATFSAILYAQTAVFRAMFPDWAMYDVRLWQAIFPGFSWTWGGVLLGLVESVVYGLTVAWYFVVLYNYFNRRAGTDKGS